MRRLFLFALTLAVLTVPPGAAGDHVPAPADMAEVRSLAAEMKEVSASLFRGAELFAHGGGPVEARLLNRLQSLERHAARFAALTAERHVDPAATEDRFSRLRITFCRSADDLFEHEFYGLLGRRRPFVERQSLGPATAEFQDVSRLMHRLMELYGYDGCGVYSWSGYGNVALLLPE